MSTGAESMADGIKTSDVGPPSVKVRWCLEQVCCHGHVGHQCIILISSTGRCALARNQAKAVAVAVSLLQTTNARAILSLELAKIPQAVDSSESSSWRVIRVPTGPIRTPSWPERYDVFPSTLPCGQDTLVASTVLKSSMMSLLLLYLGPQHPSASGCAPTPPVCPRDPSQLGVFC